MYGQKYKYYMVFSRGKIFNLTNKKYNTFKKQKYL